MMCNKDLDSGMASHFFLSKWQYNEMLVSIWRQAGQGSLHQTSPNEKLIFEATDKGRDPLPFVGENRSLLQNQQAHEDQLLGDISRHIFCKRLSEMWTVRSHNRQEV